MENPLLNIPSWLHNRDLIPIGSQNGGKVPLLGKDWQNRPIHLPEDLATLEDPACIGVGLHLTETVDIDLDRPEAVALASYFLPETTHRFSRGTPDSEHWLYRAPGIGKKTAFKHPETGKTLVEIRTGHGHQTVLPPSPHPESGTVRAWIDPPPDDEPPPEVDGAELRDGVERLAAASTILSHYPEEGGRHDFALALAGFLATQIQMSQEDATEFVRIVATAAHDDDDRRSEVSSTYRKYDADEHVTAKLLIPDASIVVLKKWLKAPSQRRGKGKVTQAQLATRIIESGCELWVTPSQEAYATVKSTGASFSVRAQDYRHWLMTEYYKRIGSHPPRNAQDQALEWAEAQAHVHGVVREAWLRYAEHEGCIYVDLGHPDRKAVRIDPEGWRIVEGESVPVRFGRSPTTAALPMPEHGGSVDLIWSHLNVSDPTDQACLLGWLLGAMRPHTYGGYAGLVFEGEAGSAKTTAARFCEKLIDPQTVGAGGPPADARALMVTAKHMHCLRFDNLRAIDRVMSDALCRLSTGGGQFNRANYTDSDLACFEAKRPWIVTGIDRVVKAEDLIDRSVIISLQPITGADRKSERDLDAAFARDAPKILGALYDAVALALKRLPEVDKSNSIRLADWGHFVEAGAPQLGFTGAIRANQSRASQSILSEDPVAAGIIELLSGGGGSTVKGAVCRDGFWEGTYDQLRWSLTGTPALGARELRTTPTLARALRRLAKPLRENGIVFGSRRDGHAKTTKVRFEKREAA